MDISYFFIIFCFLETYLRESPGWQSSLQCCVAGVKTTRKISAIANVPGDVATLNVPVASTIAADSAMADVTFANGPAWAPVSAAAVVLTAVRVPKVPAVARVSAVDVPSTIGLSNVSGYLMLLTSLLLLVSLRLPVSLLWLTSLC